MTQVTIPFSAQSIDDWRSQLHKELKENIALLHYSNEIEDLDFSLTELEIDPFLAPQEEPNSWKRMVHVSATNERQTNQYLLEALLQGADAIMIDQCHDQTDWAVLLDQIETPYIAALFVFNSVEAYQHFQFNAPQSAVEHAIPLLTYGIDRNFFSTYELQQIGANNCTELAAGLLELHQQLQQEARAQTIYFELGVGASFLIEIAKLMAFRTLLAQLARIHSCELSIQLIVRTGFSNKSLKDPYTNLLRLSTESLSAILGTANYLCIQPYDALSTHGASDFAKRMSMNIGNLLAEEAQLGTIGAPLSGAFAIEKLRSVLVEKSWNLFYELATDSGSAPEKIKQIILKTRATRKQRLEQKQDVLIGINSFANEFEAPKANWKELPLALGLPYFIIENLASHE